MTYTFEILGKKYNGYFTNKAKVVDLYNENDVTIKATMAISRNLIKHKGTNCGKFCNLRLFNDNRKADKQPHVCLLFGELSPPRNGELLPFRHEGCKALLKERLK